MNQPPVEIAALSPDERLELIEQLWDSLSPDQDVAITDAQRAELASRVAALGNGDMKTIPLDQAIAAIRAGRAARRP